MGGTFLEYENLGIWVLLSSLILFTGAINAILFGWTFLVVPLFTGTIVASVMGAVLNGIRKKTWFISDEQIHSEINREIYEAKNEVTLVSPWLAPTQHLMDKIQDALSRGVKITVFTRYYEEYGDMQYKLTTSLKDKGAELYRDRFLHAKIFIFDRKTLILCSSNLLTTSLTRNHEAGILTKKKSLVEDALDYISELQNRLTPFEG